MKYEPRLSLYGSGLRNDFANFLEGPSSVSVSSVGEIQDWLVGCRYESDESLFGESDYWQHPSEFERMRAGDCEDFAIWAWRKLIGLGYDAELIVGRRVHNGQMFGRHVWVLFRSKGAEYLLEPGNKPKDRMIWRFPDAKNLYIPEFGVDRTGKRFAFSGILITERDRHDKRLAPTA
jgi:hypothetical protein